MKNKNVIIGLAAVIIVVLSGLVLTQWKSVEDSETALDLSDKATVETVDFSKVPRLVETQGFVEEKVEKSEGSRCYYSPLIAYWAKNKEPIKGPWSVHSAVIKDDALEEFLNDPSADNSSVVMGLICNDAAFSFSESLGKIDAAGPFTNSALIVGDFAQDLCGAQSAVGIFSNGEHTIGIEFNLADNLAEFDCDPKLEERTSEEEYSKSCKKSKECTVNYFKKTETVEALKNKMLSVIKTLQFKKEE